MPARRDGKKVVEALKRASYTYVTVDLEGCPIGNLTRGFFHQQGSS